MNKFYYICSINNEKKNLNIIVMSRLKEVYAVVNNKGGVAKTTTCQNLAAAMLRKDKHLNILLIDLDPQANLSMLLGWQQNGRTIYDALVSVSKVPVYKSSNGLYYSPSSPLLQNVDIALFRQMNSKKVLAKCLANEIDNQTGEKLTSFEESFDYIIVDCPPALGEVTYNAMAIASELIVPCTLEGLSAAGIKNILDVAEETTKELNDDLQRSRLLAVMVDEHPTVSRNFLKYFREQYDMFATTIRRCVKITEAQTNLQDIYQYKSTCTTALDYESLATEILNK